MEVPTVQYGNSFAVIGGGDPTLPFPLEVVTYDGANDQWNTVDTLSLINFVIWGSVAIPVDPSLFSC